LRAKEGGRIKNRVPKKSREPTYRSKRKRGNGNALPKRKEGGRPVGAEKERPNCPVSIIKKRTQIEEHGPVDARDLEWKT